MDQELLNAGGIGAVVAAVVAAWNYRSALWQWLPSFKSSGKSSNQADGVAEDYAALLYLESRSSERPAGWAKGCAQIRKAFLPPLKDSSGEA